MTHRVLRPMHETADNSRRQLRASDTTKLTECRDVDRFQLGDSSIDSRVDRNE